MFEKRQLGLWSGVVLALLGITIFTGWWTGQPPSPKPASTPETDFSAWRAYEHMKIMAREPHPAGSVANDQVFEYIKGQVQKLGLEMVVIDEPHYNGGNHFEWRRAVLGRIRGTANTKAFAMDAHFDSVPYGPGAADDISGISAMLETARALKAGAPLKNDVIFVFADQEEVGANGAQGFAEHPWFKEVGVMLGLEVRGVKGPALMFETSDKNGWIIRELAKAGVHPRADSIMFDIYDRLPFGSDFGRYKREVPGYNVAYIDGFANYHTRLDEPERVSKASLQHHGAYCLGLARHLGNIPLDNCRAPNATYFNIVGDHMVVYPGTWDKPFSVAAWIFLAAVLILGFFRRAIRIIGLLGGVLLTLIALALAEAVWAPLAALVLLSFREMAMYQTTLYSVGFVVLAGAVCFLLWGPARRFLRPAELPAAVLLYWAGVLAFVLHELPGGAHFVLWPMVMGTVSLLGLVLAHRKDAPLSPRTAALLAVPMLPAITLLVPALCMLAYTLTALGGVILSLFAVMILGLFSAQLMLVVEKLRWKAFLICAVVGALLVGLGYQKNKPSPESPWLNSLSYAVNFDTNEAFWLSSDRTTPQWAREVINVTLPEGWFAGKKATDEWTSQYFPDPNHRALCQEFFPGDKHEYLRAPAPPAPFEGMRIDILADRVENGRRFLQLRMDSPTDAQFIDIHLDGNPPVYSAACEGIPMKVPEGGGWSLGTMCMPRPGVTVHLETAADAPLKFRVREHAYAMPDFPQYKPRPDWMAMEPNRVIDHGRPLKSGQTYTIRTIELPPAQTPGVPVPTPEATVVPAV